MYKRMSKKVNRLIFMLLAVMPVCFASPVEDRREKVMDLVVSEAVKADFPPALALAIADVGSGFEPEAVSADGGRGVMQMQPETGVKLFAVPAYRLFDARTNIATGLKHLKQLLNQYDDYLDIALSAYKSEGNDSVVTPEGLRMIPATVNYVTQVLGKREFYLKHPKVRAALDGFGGSSETYARQYAQPVETVIEMPVNAIGPQIPQAAGETLKGDYFSPPKPAVQQPLPRWKQNRPKLRIELDAKAQLLRLDDFADPNSRLNQMLALRQGNGGNVAARPAVEAEQQANAQLAAFKQLPAERQALVSNLRALRAYNLQRDVGE
ncbi:MAG: hypothetical protein ACI8WB_003390 [Phenylobacterium sp.]|jgi:hypothetical protein